ncbi:MAG: hypothetical protein HZA04_07620 [Nitrospinae bacterium]|nr:hypothetical protein [Nitrospinota bacterium]
MDRGRRDKILTEINRLLLENDLTPEDRETILENILKNHLDHMDDIEEIDMFQDRINDMIDEYVEQHFEDTMEDNYN